jgi:hypothetical protein
MELVHRCLGKGVYGPEKLLNQVKCTGQLRSLSLSGVRSKMFLLGSKTFLNPENSKHI